MALEDRQTLLGKPTDVLVVGAGQAGLATARALSECGIQCRVQERHLRVGDAWRKRFDSLVLFTTRELSTLPGLAMAGDPSGYPTKDDIADYLERYAERFNLPIETGAGIARLSFRSSRFSAITQAGQELDARAVVIATGAFQRPRVPHFAARLSKDVRQLDAVTYRNPSELEGRRIVVVGDGATGRQIALEIALAGADVTLAMGRRRNFGPQRILGKDSNVWAFKLGLLTADKDSLRARLVRALDVTPGLSLRPSALRRAGVRLAPRCIDAMGERLSFADGTSRECDTVIFALGYADDTSWIGIDGATTSSGFAQVRGVSPVPGLFYVGREWQSCRASALVCGVHRDAAVMVTHVKRYLSKSA
jgi:putative flavoprotein involved in K+ transport